MPAVHFTCSAAIFCCCILAGCPDKQPTKPELTTGTLRGQVTESNTLPIPGAQINLGYDLGPSVVGSTHRVKHPAAGFSLNQNYPNPYDLNARAAGRMKPLTDADVNGKFEISHAATSIGDTVTVTLPDSPDPRDQRVIADSITVFVSRIGYKTAARRIRFREDEAPVLNVMLERQ